MILSLVLWVLSTFPDYKELNQSRRLESSYASQIGKSIEPVFYPLGVDWRVGVGLISAFAAREVFVSSLAVIFNNTQGPEDSIKDSLLERMNTAEWPDGRKLFTKASIFSLLVFFMIAMQCMSTFATAKQEMNSLKFAILQSLSMNLVAYIAAAITYSVIS
jgi:ferrous iron transport protein B